MTSNSNQTQNEPKRYFNFLGMRAIKTVIVVFLCLLISVIRGTDPSYSVFAAIASMKSDHRTGIQAGIERIIGTVIGGIYGYFAIIGARYLGIETSGMIYYTIISIMLIPVIYTNIMVKSTESVSLSCMVFAIVAVSHTADAVPYVFVMYRVFETIIGIIISIIVNYII